MSIRVRNGHIIFDAQRLLKLAAGDAEAKWQQLFPMGVRYRRDFPDGKVNFTPQYFGVMLRNWEEAGKPSLMVDYFHKGPGEEHPIADKIAAGWIENLELRADGLYALIKWTEKARGHIVADELRCLSPYFAHNAMSRLTGKLQGPTLGGAGLLNDPFLQDLQPVSASANDPQRGSSGSSSRTNGDTVNKLICAALGIAEDSDEAAIMLALSAKLTKLGDFEKSGAKMNADVSAKLSANESALKLATEQITTLTKKLDEQATSAKDAEISATVAKLEAGHHIVADQKEKVIAYAKATSAKDAWETFSKFSAVPKGEATVPAGGAAATAETPEEAYKKLTAFAKEKSVKEKISLSAARTAVYDDPDMQALVTMANRNSTPEKRS